MTDFKVYQINDRLFEIQNDVDNCCTLIIGTKKALLFDTMSGYGDLRSCVEQLTTLPITVVNSHGHFDHVGGNYQFDEIYLSETDFPLLEVMDCYLEVIARNIGHDLSLSRQSYHQRERITPLREGMCFDLGGITAQTVALSGHTAGSMGLLLKEWNILLVGDAISPQMCLFFPESLSVAAYQKTLIKAQSLPFDWWIQGHYPYKMSKQLLQKIWDCSLLPDKKRGLPYVNTNIPDYTGLLYLLEYRNVEAGGIVCLIGKDTSHAP